MKRLLFYLLSVLMVVAVLAACLCACGADASDRTAQTGETAAAAAEETPTTLALPAAEEGWEDIYLAFLEDNYDIFAALWPDGISGVGFIDLDLDGTPEMIIFDQGASAALGVQLFDLVDGQVYCVSSVSDDAAGAFGDEYVSSVSVCTSYFEAFRLSRTEDGWCFWVNSANGTLESTWDEIVRFDCVDGVLTPVSVCARYLKSDAKTGVVTEEDYIVGQETSDQASYEAAANVYLNGEDVGYEAAGVFLWSNLTAYDTTYDGLIAMAETAAAAYVPIGETVTLVTPVS